MRERPASRILRVIKHVTDARFMNSALASPHSLPNTDSGVMPSRWRPFVIASPMALCFAVPYWRIAKVVYVSDILAAIACGVMLSQLARSKPSDPLRRLFAIAIWSIMAGVVISILTGLNKSGFNTHTLGHGTQFLLYMAYVKLLYDELVDGVSDVQGVVRATLVGVLGCAALTIAHALLLRMAPGTAIDLQSAYLAQAGVDPSRTSLSVTAVLNTTGLVRATGGWESATGAAGMLALGAVLLAYAGWRSAWRNAYYAGILVASLCTLSRHGAAIMLAVAFFLLGEPSGPLVRRIAGAVTTMLMVLGLLQALDAYSSLSRELTITQAVEQRVVERTSNEGFSDSSFEGRYIAGTERFLRYVAREPAILMTGFGVGSSQDERRSYYVDDPDQNGFVSNSWLLVIWQFGLLGFGGLAMLHLHLFRVGDLRSWGVGIATGLIILSDNYAAYVPRCFYLICAVLAIAWASLTLQRLSTSGSDQAV